jgi:hypothetical protein
MGHITENYVSRGLKTLIHAGKVIVWKGSPKHVKER